MVINFILPRIGNIPIGGFKVVYEYANGLVKSGNMVNLIHPVTTNNIDSLYSKLKVYKWLLERKISNSYLPDKWFKLNSKINTILVPNLSEKFIPNADFIVATQWNTAEICATFNIRKGKKYYLIQNYEFWDGGKTRVLNTFKLPLKKIVISHWLEKLVRSQGEDSTCIPNGFDFNAFSMDVSPEKRDKKKVMMLYHKLFMKGSDLGLKAIKKLKILIPDLSFILYGAYTPPKNLPSWISFYKSPEQILLRKLYNEASIFISPSYLEGFPLPPAEAMICGATLVASDIGGHREYAIPNENALLYPPTKIMKLINNIKFLIGNNDYRIKLAYNGLNFMKQFTWERSVSMFESLLKKDI